MERVQRFDKRTIGERITEDMNMNKTEYLAELSKYLKRVPKQDLDDALEYYEEYFEEAGVENEQKIIEELGTPKDLAKKIIIECVDKNFSEDYEPAEISTEVVSDKKDEKKEKKSLSPWLILAAIFALPLSPIVIVLLIVVLAIAFSVIVSLIAVFVSMGLTAIVGAISALVAIVAMFANPTGGLMMFGVSLIVAALGAIFFCLVFTLFDLLIKALTKAGSKLVHKKAGAK